MLPPQRDQLTIELQQGSLIAPLSLDIARPIVGKRQPRPAGGEATGSSRACIGLL
ncbi:hypothetical protein [Bradyrhizobium sp. STM 3562]|uniref:hypothetical protein n=1 Tax=Bradyrhizobium sp. STM 3562 TaxID=578924 RepID=UPI00388FB1C7